MPAAPLLVIAAGATGTSAAIGATVAAAVTGATVSTAVATAVGSGLISGAITAVQGGDAGDVLKSAVVGGTTSYVGGQVGGAVQQSLKASTSQAVANSVSAAAAGGTANTLGAIAYGATPQQALEAGAKGAVVAGGTQAGVESVKGAIESQPQARLKAPATALYQSGIGGESAPQPSVGFTSKVPTGGGQGFVAPADSLYASRFAPSTSMRLTEDGGVQPAYQTAQSLLTPESLAGTAGPFREQRQYTTPTLSSTEESALREALQLGIGGLFDQRKQAPDMGGGTMQRTAVVGPTQTQAAPGSQALAQALRIGDVGAPIFGKDGEEGRKAGWNVESLRYMGNSEA